MAAYQISTGAIKIINSGGAGSKDDLGYEPVLQVKDFKLIGGGQGGSRYRVSLTDGADAIMGIITTGVAHFVQDNLIVENSIIRVTQFSMSNQQGMLMMIVVDLDLVEKFASPINPDLAAPSVPMQQVSSSSSGAAAAAGGGSSSSSSSSSSSNNNNNMANSSASSVYGQSSYGHAAAAVTKPVMRAEAQSGVIPIRGLNPYNQRWAIKARVTNKGEKKTWNNAKGTGTLFSIDLLDSDGGEIRGTFFKDTCEKFFPIIEQQKVYTFSGGSLKPANRKYSNIDNAYEITFDDKTTISPVEDDATIDNIKFDFIKIRDTESDEMVGKTVDVIGFVKSAGECAKITSKNQAGKEFEKRDLVVIDDSGAEIKVTLWGEKAKEEPGWDLAPVCAFKSLKVSDYGGRSLSMNSNGFFQVNPTIPEGYALFAWFQGQGTDKIQNVSSTSMSTGGRSEGGALDPLEKRKCIGSIKTDLMGRGDKPDYCTIKGQVTFIRHDSQPWYDACTVGDCKKKVIAVMGRYKCDKCNIDMDDVNRRYVMSAQISDHTGQNWFSFFDAEGTKLLGMSAQELHLLKESEGEGAYNDVFTAALFKPIVMKVRVKEESFGENGEKKVKCALSAFNFVDWVAENKMLLSAIEKWD